MGTFRNILAIIGLLAIVVVVLFVAQIWNATRDFDPNAFGLYQEFATKLLETRDIADAFVWAVPAEEGVSAEDVKESLKSLAVARNFLFVGDSPFYKQAEAVTGEPFRHVSLMNFCDVRVGIKMIDQNDAYTAFMPCTISVVEDKQGNVTMFTLNMDFLIHGARELPADLKSDAIRIRRTMRDIMEGAARGEF